MRRIGGGLQVAVQMAVPIFPDGSDKTKGTQLRPFCLLLLLRRR